ncbi:MAG: thiol oxidoreductase [Myxococcales bacterium FL481]|nr:MAG: thiol oxidoreductase [Myxococcales bacterium FL481]
MLPILSRVAACVQDGEVLDEAERRPGGQVTNDLLLGAQAYATPAPEATAENRQLFFAGNSFFNQPWVEAPASTANRDGIGPLFNARSCAGCHFRDGRGEPPTPEDPTALGLLLRLSVPGAGPHGEVLPEPRYGGQLQPFSNPGVPAEGQIHIDRVALHGAYADGEAYSLEEPFYSIAAPGYGELAPDLLLSPRVAPAVFGVGLLEAIGTEDVESWADPDDADGDGISGRPNRVWDVAAGELRLGRFGWKAEQPSVRQQSAGAFLGDMGLTSSLFPEQECSPIQLACLSAADGGRPEVEDHLLHRVDVYQRLLAVPIRQRWDDDEVLAGRALFREIGCADCHRPSFVTSQDDELEELHGQRIWPYTDLLLHDMGEGLADHRPSFAADGREWRTPPLWGLGLIPVVNGHNRLLHDGRARGVAEAILWHGGEAEASRDAFVLLDAEERHKLVSFVESL